MKEKDPLIYNPRRSRNRQFLVLTMFPVYFLICGLASSPIKDIIPGLITIIKEPDFLITDYIAIGGMGAAFVNASLLTIMCIAIIYFLNMDMDGNIITSIFLMMGFSLFGKNIVNIWAIILGVAIYTFYHKVPLSKYIHVAFYGTSLSPIITQIVAAGHLPWFWSLLLAILIGLVMGFVLPPLAVHLLHAHHGFSLYNAGFAAGLIATVVVSVFKSIGFEIDSRDIWSTGNNTYLSYILFGFFIILIIIGMVHDHDFFRKYLDILKHPGKGGTDFFKDEGLSATMVNMGINGIVATALVLMVNSDLNGPTIGCIFTIVGFSATGKHLRNILPIIAGVLLASLVSVWQLTDHKAILALLLSTTLAPIAGQFGIVAGVIAGFLQVSLSLNIGLINGGMNLYNNGFAGGLIATFLVPLFLSFETKDFSIHKKIGGLFHKKK